MVTRAHAPRQVLPAATAAASRLGRLLGAAAEAERLLPDADVLEAAEQVCSSTGSQRQSTGSQLAVSWQSTGSQLTIKP
jgi:hypothetical protein